MRWTLKSQAHVAVLTIYEPALTGGAVDEFKNIFQSLPATFPHLVLDMSPITIIDGAGCCALLTAIGLVDRVGGQLRFCGVHDSVRHTLAHFQMLRFLDIDPAPQNSLPVSAPSSEPMAFDPVAS